MATLKPTDLAMDLGRQSTIDQGLRDAYQAEIVNQLRGGTFTNANDVWGAVGAGRQAKQQQQQQSSAQAYQNYHNPGSSGPTPEIQMQPGWTEGPYKYGSPTYVNQSTGEQSAYMPVQMLQEPGWNQTGSSYGSPIYTNQFTNESSMEIPTTAPYMPGWVQDGMSYGSPTYKNVKTGATSSEVPRYEPHVFYDASYSGSGGA